MPRLLVPSGAADEGLPTRRSLRHHSDRELGGAVGEEVRCPDVLHNLVFQYMHVYTHHTCGEAVQLHLVMLSSAMPECAGRLLICCVVIQLHLQVW